MHLPTEIYEHIMLNLDHRTLLTCMRVCTFFRYIIATTASLQYIIELALAGQVDNPQCNLSAAVRLEILRKHQSAWKVMGWSREYDIPMESGDLWELYGGVLGMSTPYGALVFHQLPSDLRSIDQKIWTIGPDFGIREMRDFTMDPAQDLLVLFETPDWSLVHPAPEYCLHLRSLTTGKAHPLAKNTSSLCVMTRGPMEVSRIIQISGHLIMLLLLTDLESELLIWDWQMGELLSNIYGEIMSASLLSDNWVLFPSDEGDHPALTLVDFRKEGNTRHRLDQLANAIILVYPQVSSEIDLIEMTLRCDPRYKKWHLCRHIPDYNTFIRRMLAPFITRDHLLSMITAVPDLSAIKLWAEWAVSGTRLLIPRRVVSETWVCNVYGNKYALDYANNVGRLLDFNQSMLRKNAQAGDDDMVPGLLDTFVAPELASYFEEVVETTLPFRCQEFNLQGSVSVHSSVMCCEDNVVVVDESTNRFHVLVF